jgi:HEAT repeat protein/PDZ domain-containing protein
MRPQFGFVLLAAGLAIGFVVARLLAGGGNEGAPAELARQRDEAVARADRTEAELASVRDAKKRTRAEGAGPRGEVPPDTRAPADPPSAAGEKNPGDAPVADKAAAARARLRTARDEVQAALAAKDGTKVLALLKELAGLARDLPEARDDAMKLAIDVNRDVNGPGELHLSEFAYYSGLGEPEMRDLMMWSLENQGASPSDFRVLAAWSIPWAFANKPDEAIAIFEATLSREPDRSVQDAIVRNLASMNTPKAEALLAKVFGDPTRDAALRGDAAMALATSKDPAVQRAIESAAQSDPDPRVQAAAKLSLIARDPPATGCLVTATSPDGNAEAAGIRAGDIIVSYNGHAVPSMDELVKEREAVAASGAEAVAVVVVRDGREQTMQVKSGRLGLPNLRPVKKK